MKKSEECRRDYSVTVPPPTVNLYPIIEQHPNEITRGNNLQSQPLPPVYSQSTGNINEPPPYNEQQQHHISCPIGVRYFVHGQQEGGRCSNNNDGREFHAIHTNIPNNGDTVFYYISTSPSNPGCKRSEPFLLIRRRRTSIASIALSLFIISIILIVFVRMHTEFTRKYQEVSITLI
ncbi:hypothetical protein Mgra_00002240 [Meloidogyne graminicola]|uniref:Uncharacterized protein n=1 Tax=Meloidogyne graminicola TaxID=189291 RepID=A0A8S9ZZ29_9BILA|nr:hypothetical protein Mgra_00002240 [Meloidogyne graminicola]